MSKDANSFGHDKALAWESRGFVYTKKRMHRFDTPSFLYPANPRTWISSFLSSPRSMLADADMPDKPQELPYLQ